MRRVHSPGRISGEPKHGKTVTMDPVVWEAIEEMATALVAGRSELIERILCEWLDSYEMPERATR